MGVYTLCSVKKKNGRSIFIFLNTNLEGNIYFSFPERKFGREYLLFFFLNTNLEANIYLFVLALAAI